MEERLGNIGVGTRLHAGHLRNQGWFPADDSGFSLLLGGQTDCGSKESCYLMIVGCYPISKLMGARSWPLSLHLVPRLWMTENVRAFFYMPLWRVPGQLDVNRTDADNFMQWFCNGRFEVPTAVFLKIHAYGGWCCVAGWVISGVSTDCSAVIFMVEQPNRTSRAGRYCFMGNSLPLSPHRHTHFHWSPSHSTPCWNSLIGKRRHLIIRSAGNFLPSDTKSRPRKPILKIMYLGKCN